MSELARIVAAARERRVTVAAPAAGDDTLAGAYAIQRDLFAGRELAGYKLGLTSPAKREQMGQDSPIYGRVDQAMLHGEPSVALDSYIQPRFEPEIAIVLRGAVGVRPTPGDVARAIGGVFLAVDILDSIWEGYKFTLPQVVADNTSGGGFVLGDRSYPGLPSGALTAHLDGEPVGSGDLSAVGDPIANLCWLAGEVGGLSAGQVIFLGSPIAATAARPGLLEIGGPDSYSLTVRLR